MEPAPPVLLLAEAPEGDRQRGGAAEPLSTSGGREGEHATEESGGGSELGEREPRGREGERRRI